jgi:class 6 POU domain transcription factor
LKTGAHHNFADLLGNENAKKRKRRTSFTPQALEVLNEYFEKNTHPSGNQGADMTMLAQKLNYDREVIRVWFCNKRQALKNTMKKIKSDNPNDILNSSQNSNNSINGTNNNGIDQSDVTSSTQTSNANGGIGSTLNLLNATVVVNNQQSSNASNNSQQQQAPTKTVITLTNDDLKLESSNNSNNNKNLNDLILNHINSNENNYSDLKIREIVKSD